MPIVEPEPQTHMTLSQDLARLLTDFAGRHVSLGELADAMKGRGTAMLIILMAAPFILIPLPGLAEPMGVVIAISSLGLLKEKRPWLPEWIRKHTLSPIVFERIIGATKRVAGWMENLLRPRLGFMFGPIQNRVLGYAMLFSGLLLAVPLLLPFTHAIRSIPIVLLAAGWMERDGLCLILGHLTLLIATVVSIWIVWVGIEHVLIWCHY
jgi:hypothetical protein